VKHAGRQRGVVRYGRIPATYPILVQEGGGGGGGGTRRVGERGATRGVNASWVRSGSSKQQT